MMSDTSGELDSADNPGNLSSYWKKYITYEGTSEFKENLLKAYLKRLTVQTLQIVLVVVGGLILVMWPVDYWIFAVDFERSITGEAVMNAFEIWKPVVLIIITTALVGFTYSDFFRRNVHSILILFLCLAFGTVSYSFARLEDAAGPWFQVMFMIPWATIVMEVKPLRRIISTFLVPAAYVLGYAIEFPGYLDHPDAIITMAVTGGIVLVSTAFGHTFYHLTRQNFFKDRILRRNEMEMEHLANYDQLTGLTNRRHFEEKYEEEFERAQRHESVLSIMILDIDHFKDVNDTYGHQTGDAVLEELGTIIERDARTSDFASRYGGEEFCVVLPETEMDGACTLANRLRMLLKDTVFKSSDGDEFSVTCSIGVAELDAGIEDSEELVKMADEALYQAKESGRDQIVRANDM